MAMEAGQVAAESVAVKAGVEVTVVEVVATEAVVFVAQSAEVAPAARGAKVVGRQPRPAR